MKMKNLPQRLFYTTRISLKFDREIKIFTDKQKLREISIKEPVLQQMVKELF